MRGAWQRFVSWWPLMWKSTHHREMAGLRELIRELREGLRL